MDSTVMGPFSLFVFFPLFVCLFVCFFNLILLASACIYFKTWRTFFSRCRGFPHICEKVCVAVKSFTFLSVLFD